MSPKQPRSVGSLTINRTRFKDGVFTAEMVFQSISSRIGDDEALSCAQSCRRNFQNLLHSNGFWSYDANAIDYEMIALKPNQAAIVMSVKCAGGLPKKAQLSTTETEH